ncbi:hypothetical protein [Streptomyces sp. NPDC056194]|uniref:hypothetical protein n=1 Tax=Streptomyces sp. NPDC056194 TaxID=3345744 RepID=UPI0035D64A83
MTLRGESVTIEVTSVETLEYLAASPHLMCRLRAEYESISFKFGDTEVPLGPCVETYTMDKVLNMKAAQRALARTGLAMVRLRVSSRFPVTRRLGVAAETS